MFFFTPATAKHNEKDPQNNRTIANFSEQILQVAWLFVI